MSKVIITDVDGCILNWSNGFIEYIKSLNMDSKKDLNSCWDLEEYLGLPTKEVDNLAKDFNITNNFKHLKSDYKSDVYIPLLHGMGYDFIAITACGSSDITSKYRTINLNELFPGIFKEIFCCDHNYEKNDILKNLPNSKYWVEDHYHNCKFGIDNDHVCFLMDPYNNHKEDNSVISVSDWEEIYERIILDVQ